MISTIVEIVKIDDFSEQGFYSHAYLALDKRLDRKVAVKDFVYAAIKSDADFEHYFDEARKLSIASHPRVLPVYYVGIERNESDRITPRIVTQYFERGSLNSYLNSLTSTNKSISLDQAIRFTHDIIQGMIHLHALDIVHLDMKASNIFIGDDGKLVLADFGHSRLLKDGVIRDSETIYPAIQPKEQRTKKIVDKSADIYQFGMLLYSILCYPVYRSAIDDDYQISNIHLKEIFRDSENPDETRKKEFILNVKRYQTDVNNGNFPAVDSYPAIIPKQLKAIISKCLAPVVADRYNNFYQIQQDINAIVFPKGISNYHLDFATDTVHFQKKDAACELSLVMSDGKYQVTAKKNNRSVNNCAAKDVSVTKIAKALFILAEKI